MPLSKTQIANQALLACGQQRITDADTDTANRAQVFRDIYDHTKRELLERHRWNFATKQAQLALTTAPLFGWKNAFQLPSDFIRLLGLERSDVKYDIQQDTLLTDEGDVKINYVFDASESDMTAMFQQVLSDTVAHRLAMALRADKELVRQRYQIAEESLKEARFQDSTQQSYLHNLQPSAFLDAKLGLNRIDRSTPQQS